jgi:hypothetical protein
MLTRTRPEQPGCLRPQEVPPAGIAAAKRRSQAGTGEDAPSSPRRTATSHAATRTPGLWPGTASESTWPDHGRHRQITSSQAVRRVWHGTRSTAPLSTVKPVAQRRLSDTKQPRRLRLGVDLTIGQRHRGISFPRRRRSPLPKRPPITGHCRAVRPTLVSVGQGNTGMAANVECGRRIAGSDLD